MVRTEPPRAIWLAAASVAVHGVTFFLLDAIDKPAADRAAVSRASSETPIEIVTPSASNQDTPLEVTLLEHPPQPASGGAQPRSDRSPRVRSRTPSAAARSGDRPAEVASTSEGTGDAAQTPKPGMMSMRLPGLRALVGASLAADAERPHSSLAPTTPPEEPSGLLAPKPGGTAVADQGVFTMNVRRDGSVKFRDRRNLQVGIALPTRRDLGHLIDEWSASLGNGPYQPRSLEPLRETSVDEDSRIGPKPIRIGAPDDPEHRREPVPIIVPVLRGSFDVTDWAMRSGGADPYAARKLSVLNATRAERIGMSRAAHKEALRQAGDVLRKQLVRMWAQPELDAPTRRQLLFELWDACLERGSADELEAAEQVRKLLVGWIRSRLPKGSDREYTVDELAKLNRGRASSQVFSPYEP